MRMHHVQVEIMYHLGGNSNIIQLYDVYEDADTIHLILVSEPRDGARWRAELLLRQVYWSPADQTS